MRDGQDDGAGLLFETYRYVDHRIAAVSDALDEDVSDAQREIFDLYYGDGRPTKVIADELGKSNQAVKISLFRTRRAMEARLEELGIQAIA